MKKVILSFLLIFLTLSSGVHADKIYLKSGEILKGKLKKNKEPEPWEDWCVGADDIELREEGRGQCLKEADIEKVEKEYNQPEGIALLAVKGKWGKEQYGYTTKLIPQNEEYTVGKPMVFHLLLKNVSEDLKWYDSQAITRNALLIKDETGQEVYYKKGSFQTLGAGRPIDKGEIVSLFENRNIADEYVIAEKGKYSIQFRGGNYGMSRDSNFPPSNIIEIDVKEGDPDSVDHLIIKMSNIVPDIRWKMSPGFYRNAPVGRSEVKGRLLNFVRHPDSNLKEDVVSVQIWQTEGKAYILDDDNSQESVVSEYLGKDDIGKYYYIYVPENANKFWPSFKEDVKAVLPISN